MLKTLENDEKVISLRNNERPIFVSQEKRVSDLLKEIRRQTHGNCSR